MGKFRLTISGLTCLALLLSGAHANDRSESKSRAGSIALIEDAYKAGRISKGDKIFHSVQALYAPENLPLSLKSETPAILKSGTHYILEARRNWDILSNDQRSLLTSFFSRPPYDTVYISPEENFAIHYDTIGVEAVPMQDSDGDKYPDFVERIGLYADSVFRAFHTNLDYLPVPPDGDEHYDIYLLSIGAYGITIPEEAGPSEWNDYSSYIQMNNNYTGFPENDDPEGNVVGALKVTCAHEYSHAVQLAYNVGQDLWLMECTAVFFEDYLFTEVNDYYQYLGYFFLFPEQGLKTEEWHMYASSIWPEFLVKKYDINLLQEIFWHGRYNNSISATNLALMSYGVGVGDVFPEFTLWNYFTDDRSDPQYYNESAFYPSVDGITLQSFPYTAFSPQTGPDGLGASYIVAHTDPGDDGYVRYIFDGADNVDWAVTVLSFFDGDQMDIDEYGTSSEGIAEWGLYDVAKYDSVVMIPCVVSEWLSNNDFSLEASLVDFGDIDLSGALDVLDIIYLIDFKFKDGPPPVDSDLADTDCSGDVNILDIILLIDHKFKDKPAPVACQQY
jgi:hypothetical protein